MAKKILMVLLLGGFHMSSVGSIGSPVENSGLSTALETIDGPISVKHMLTGKAIAMSLRGHFLVESALMTNLLSTCLPVANHPSAEPIINDNNMNQDDAVVDDIYRSISLEMDENDSENSILSFDEMEKLSALIETVENDFENGIHAINTSQEIARLESILDCVKEKLKSESRTAKLWILYMFYMQVLKDFIRAERTGNWSLHVQSVGKMLNLFAATGHIHYAKCARLYLQQMLQLEQNFPWVYGRFNEEDFHTVRRSSRFWAGFWTDLTIEQVLMRSVKSRGGLTRGKRCP